MLVTSNCANTIADEPNRRELCFSTSVLDTHPAHRTKRTLFTPKAAPTLEHDGECSLSPRGSPSSPSGLPVLRVGEEHRMLLQECWRHWHSHDRPCANACATPQLIQRPRK